MKPALRRASLCAPASTRSRGLRAPPGEHGLPPDPVPNHSDPRRPQSPRPAPRPPNRRAGKTGGGYAAQVSRQGDGRDGVSAGGRGRVPRWRPRRRRRWAGRRRPGWSDWCGRPQTLPCVATSRPPRPANPRAPTSTPPAGMLGCPTGGQPSCCRAGGEPYLHRRCADWLAQLDVGGYPPAVNLRPAGDWPDTAHIARRPCAGARSPPPHRGRPGRTRPRPAGGGPDYRGHAARPAGGAPPAARRAGPRLPRLLLPPGIAHLLHPAAGAGLGRLARRKVPAWRS